ncbi:nitroreductase family deazaflavin-dependent oxidoreductase [Actinomycetospora termitidis]|uniref:Nitroreductase family deazaflavin-dependent oxidoreductase n=1 Tax=Actinomycetospora termitidis TaxID=3053470 RepID=A0ABT7M4M0_9PSEU|nr:nitroreductase family deazaflavin-dependent oxidoreductase [Actinomycetospora sp. Odt1-22]MDL5155599.1 nitroreductase family deazaflavin-dependent oxidoreductase [Actinomycetospora sp. Odt1-22]
MIRYVDADPVRRAIRTATTSRPLAWLSARVLHRIDGVVVRATNGRSTFSGWVSGLPVVLLTTTGARTGLARTTPVLGIPDGAALIVLAANFGKTTHPAWYHNVRATPEVDVAVDGRSRRYHAVELTGDDRDHWFARAVELNPGWLRYRTWAGERAIPVVQLTPTG